MFHLQGSAVHNFLSFKSEGSYNCNTSSQVVSISHQTSENVPLQKLVSHQVVADVVYPFCLVVLQLLSQQTHWWSMVVVGSQILFPWQHWTRQLASCDPQDSGVQLVSDRHLCKSRQSVNFFRLIFSVFSFCSSTLISFP